MSLWSDDGSRGAADADYTVTARDEGTFAIGEPRSLAQNYNDLILGSERAVFAPIEGTDSRKTASMLPKASAIIMTSNVRPKGSLSWRTSRTFQVRHADSRAVPCLSNLVRTGANESAPNRIGLNSLGISGFRRGARQKRV